MTDEDSFTWTSGDRIWMHTTAGGIVGTLSAGGGTGILISKPSAYGGDITFLPKKL